MANHEQSVSIPSEAPVDQQGLEVSVDERTGRRIITTGINPLSKLVHTSFERIELDDITIPYDQ
jgi:hypothetical protein